MEHNFVEVLVEDSRWEAERLECFSEQACRAVFAYFSMPRDGFEISVMGCDDARIAGLNENFRDKPTPTNVLSWPSQERATPGQRPQIPETDPTGMPIELGDIAISYDTCKREAQAAGKNMNHHVTHLIVHAVLHLLGYDHINAQDAAIMEGIEVEILCKLGIENPY